MFRSEDLKYLLNDHGKNLTLTVKSSLGTYNTVTGALSGGTSTTHTVRGYFYNYNLRDVDGINVLRGDRRLVISIKDTSGVAIPEPDVGDEVSGEGDKVSVVSVAQIMSGSEAVCYILQVRE